MVNVRSQIFTEYKKSYENDDLPAPAMAAIVPFVSGGAEINSKEITII